jgi:DNA-binding NarL/FixJ family response regulator
MLAGSWAAAAGLWDRLGVPWEAALCRSETDDPEALADASMVLHRLGARADAARTAQRMRLLGLAVIGSPRRTTAANPGGLTDRELEVARLMSEGRTNAEIAETLFISTKTAAHHVSAILGKVGARNRREAAVTVSAWVAP